MVLPPAHLCQCFGLLCEALVSEISVRGTTPGGPAETSRKVHLLPVGIGSNSTSCLHVCSLQQLLSSPQRAGEPRAFLIYCPKRQGENIRQDFSHIADRRLSKFRGGSSGNLLFQDTFQNATPPPRVFILKQRGT